LKEEKDILLGRGIFLLEGSKGSSNGRERSGNCK
jgi:hypothetical protein